jgi:glutaredoxin 3
MQNCPFCVKAKALLTQRGLAFNVDMIDEWSDDKWDAFVKKTGMKTVPQIFVDEKLIGGYTQLAEIDAQDKLESLK